MSIGFTEGLGGGWADQVLAHRSMLHPLPDAVPDAIASLHEPVSVAVHGLLRKPPRDGDPVLVVGAGIIGLAAVAAVRALFPACEVTVSARHDIKATRRAPPARTTWCSCRTVRALRGAGHDLRRDRARPRHGQMLLGGFPYVIEAVGRLESSRSRSGSSTTGGPCCSSARRRGRGRSQRAVVQGGRARRRWNHAHGVHPTRGSHHSIDLALEVLARGGSRSRP
jgi:threonine dehydrogenase-like Zn-dependent dehydrogenase